jgi:citrate lyase beta subunit
MLRKSLVTGSDVIIYDLEDSVAPSEEGKDDARERLMEFLTARLFNATNVYVADCPYRKRRRTNYLIRLASPSA